MLRKANENLTNKIIEYNSYNVNDYIDNSGRKL